ncbi:MAG TPA: DUF4232 domain-containing protein [Jatrophihabitantaceae bacterium]|jgi:hypothetical protein|nr:DUF4232 domain-containing protein [Jatrophihabitantaceae bacterium]
MNEADEPRGAAHDPTGQAGRSRTVNTVIVVLLLALTAGCTASADSSGHPGQTPSSAPPSTSSPLPSTPNSATPSSPTPTPTISAVTLPPPGSTAPAGTPGCTTTGLSVRITRGSGASGQVVSTITFTNTSSAPCTLTGYPGVSLLLNGSEIGQPAARSGSPGQTVTLAAGAAAQAPLNDATTCNASESDTVRIYPPNQTVPVLLPVTLRACALTVGAVHLQ